MATPRYDVIAIGNAIVDVMAPCSDDLIDELALNRGDMTLIDAERAHELYQAMGPAREISGGSAANTLAGLAQLGAQCAFIGQVARDQLGEVFAHDIRAGGIDFEVPPREGHPPTARCLIFVTPDAQRTMNTFLGASQFMPPASVNPEHVADSAILFLEGYLWEHDEPRAAMLAAIEAARAAGREVALTLSAVFVVERHRESLMRLIDEGQIDILLANDAEFHALTGESDLEAALGAFAGKVSTLVVTRSEKGALAIRNGERVDIAAEPIDEVIDTTGAGDLFAAGFFFGHVRGEPLEKCLRRGAIASAEIISHFGARTEEDLKELMKAKLG